MLKKKYIFFTSFLFLLVAFLFFKIFFEKHEYCVASGEKCVEINGGWKIVPLMTSKKSLVFLRKKYIYFGQEQIMDIYFLDENEALDNFGKVHSTPPLAYQFGSVKILDKSLENKKYFSFSNFLGGTANIDSIITCDNDDCLISIHSIYKK